MDQYAYTCGGYYSKASSQLFDLCTTISTLVFQIIT